MRFPQLLPDTRPPAWLIGVEAITFVAFAFGADGLIMAMIFVFPLIPVYIAIFLAHCWALLFVLYKFLLVPILPVLGYILIMVFLPDLPVLGFVDPRSPGSVLLFLFPALMTGLWWGGYMVLRLVERRSKVGGERS